MNNLKIKHNEKCFSLLREFIENSGAEKRQKGIANLALNQLQKITAGTGSQNHAGGNGAAAQTTSTCDQLPRIP